MYGPGCPMLSLYFYIHFINTMFYSCSLLQCNRLNVTAMNIVQLYVDKLIRADLTLGKSWFVAELTKNSHWWSLCNDPFLNFFKSKS